MAAAVSCEVQVKLSYPSFGSAAVLSPSIDRIGNGVPDAAQVFINLHTFSNVTVKAEQPALRRIDGAGREFDRLEIQKYPANVP